MFHEMVVGESAALELDADGGTDDFEITCSDPSVVDVDSDGVLHARAPGHASVTVRSGDVETLLNFHVTPTPRVAAVLRVSPETLHLETSEIIELLVRAIDASNSDIPMPSTLFTFSSSDDNVAYCTPTGHITGRTVGKSRIDVSLGVLTASCNVTVYPATVSRLTVAERSLTLGLRETRAIVVRAFDKRNNLADAALVFESANQNVARVDDKGVIEARSPGMTTISVRAGEIRTSIELTVTPARVASIHVSANPLRLKSGERVRVDATPYDAFEVELTGRTLTWESDNPDVATVTDNGIVTAIRAGTATLTVSCQGTRQHVGVAVYTVPNR